MKIESNIVTTAEEVKVVKLVETKTLHLTIEVDQRFLDFINGIGRITDASMRSLGANPAEVSAIYPFYRAVNTQLTTKESKEFISAHKLGGDFKMK